MKHGGIKHRLYYAFKGFKLQFSSPSDNTTPEDDKLGGAYNSYDAAVQEIGKKIDGSADYGCSIFNTVYFCRSVIAVGNGPEIETDKKNEVDEFSKAWLKEFLTFNGFGKSSNGALEWMRTIEAEGKILVKLFFDQNHTWQYSGDIKKGMVAIKVITYKNNKYKITADKNNYSRYVSAKLNGDLKDTLKENTFAYGKIGGYIDEPNSPHHPLWDSLDYCDTIDKAIRDLRGSNRLFATPVPVTRTNSVEAFRAILENQEVLEKNFRQNKMFYVADGDFTYAVPDMSGSQSLLRELELNIKLLSSCTGIPVHFLGLAEFVKNRSTSDDSSREEMNMSTLESRNLLTEVLNESANKAAQIYREASSGIIVDMAHQGLIINLINDTQWKQIQETLIPLRENGDISRRTLHERIPGIDPDEESQRLKQEAEDNAAFDFETSNERADEIENFTEKEE